MNFPKLRVSPGEIYMRKNSGKDFIPSSLPQAVAQLPWGNNRLIVSKVEDVAEALFYCQATI